MASMTCLAMCGNGPAIGTKARITKRAKKEWWIHGVRLKKQIARISLAACCAVVAGLAFHMDAARRIVMDTTQSVAITLLAFAWREIRNF